jgi:hypothetical protein
MRGITPEIIEQQKGIGLGRIAKAEGTVQMDACALHRGLGAAGFGNGTKGHDGPPVSL